MQIYHDIGTNADRILAKGVVEIAPSSAALGTDPALALPEG